jgi:hypothetical protein
MAGNATVFLLAMIVTASLLIAVFRYGRACVGPIRGMTRGVSEPITLA